MRHALCPPSALGAGKLLMAQCSSTLKKLSLELGGNAPFIVFEDADVDAAASVEERARPDRQ
jgi:acyl-CoA reductase-like NAD-dependent aldehyde dehydrogenase